ncbi:MAG: restriction endonuclease subunit S [Proteobacteria bacterium]|nr:restriction endonuclease subunit S [Pseudomonadota bacterium]
MIRTTNVKGGFIDMTDVGYVTKETFEKWTRRSKPLFGDVILTREAPVGEVGRYTSADEGVFLGQRLFQYRPDPRVLDWNFLAYALQSHEVQGRLRSMGFGATVEHIKVGDAENLLIPCPSIDVQRQIGSTLSAYDDLIENNRRRMALLEESARLLYREWFVHLRSPGHEHTRIVDGVPEGWDQKALGDLCDNVRETVHPEALEADTPYIGLEHMPRRSISLGEWGRADEVTSTKHRFRTGEILFGKIRPYFHKVGVAFVDGVASSDAIVIRPVDEKLQCLVLMTTSSDEFVAVTAQQMKEGSKMPRADWKQMQQYAVLVPPDGLLGDFNGWIQPIVEQLKALCFANRRLRAARDLLLPRLMSGELTV